MLMDRRRVRELRKTTCWPLIFVLIRPGVPVVGNTVILHFEVGQVQYIVSLVKLVFYYGIVKNRIRGYFSYIVT
jgi:hypothetical protein